MTSIGGKGDKEIEEHWFYNNKTHSIYSSKNYMNCPQIPKELGNGHVKQLFACPFAQIKDSAMNQLAHCPYHDSVRTIYIEGKLLEFLAVYLNEIIYQQETMPSSYSSLSRQDVKSIYQAKQFLDQSFVSPPTLAALSKLICLNEFKLKNGFKQLFGQPVHAYVVTKRLELAKQLFEEKKLNVSEAAAHIGYSNASYFALAFRKKFGVSPSEYLSQKE